MHPNEQTIRDFYQHFAQKDHQKMSEAYADNAVFLDEMFTLEGIKEVAGMWQMLCQAASEDFRVVCTKAQANDTEGSAEWEAFYTFSVTGRKIHNRLKAKFQFENGKIKFHQDTFSFWKWASQAFGLMGFLLGGTSFFKKKVRTQINERLKKFIHKNNY